MKERELVCVLDYRYFEVGDTVIGQISEDDQNFYNHSVNDEYPQGYLSNYMVLPKYAFKERRVE